ncbi:MAG TPA: hypothetical protein VFF30_19155 [Nitrososphaerales archaeon]|nr:hypothetical protein [Nitrososphaerales archaeon]
MFSTIFHAISHGVGPSSRLITFFSIYNPIVDVLIGVGVVLLGLGLYMLYADYG